MSAGTRHYFEFKTLAQIRCLASMTRLAIVDTLEAVGPLSVLELARYLGRPSDSLYYHIRALAKLKLIVPTGTRSTAGRTLTLYDIVGRPTALRYDPTQKRNADAVTRVAATTFRFALRQFRRAFRPGVRVQGPERQLWTSGRIGRLSREDLRRVNALLAELGDIFEASNKREEADELYTLQFILAPVR